MRITSVQRNYSYKYNKTNNKSQKENGFLQTSNSCYKKSFTGISKRSKLWIFVKLLNKLPIKLTPYDNQSIKEFRQIAEYNGTHQKQTLEINTPERKRLRASIIDKWINSNPNVNIGRNCYMIVGNQGAGKSTFGEQLTKKVNALHLDPDKIKFDIPEFKQDKTLFHVIRDEALWLRQQIFDKAVEKGYDIILEDSAINLNETIKKIKEIKANGYNIHLKLVDLSINKSTQRSVSRFIETGRFADPIINTYLCSRTKQNFLKLSKLMKNVICSSEIYSSDVPKGEPFKQVSGT